MALKIWFAPSIASAEEDAKEQVRRTTRRQYAIIPSLDAAQVQFDCYECGTLQWRPLFSENDMCARCRSAQNEAAEVERAVKREQLDVLRTHAERTNAELEAFVTTS